MPNSYEQTLEATKKWIATGQLPFELTSASLNLDNEEYAVEEQKASLSFSLQSLLFR